MTRAIVSTAIVLILTVIPATSCSTATESCVQPTSFLWEVSSDLNTVYVLGSVHIAKVDLYPLHEVIEDAYDSSEILVAEIDLINTSQEEVAQLPGVLEAVSLCPSAQEGEDTALKEPLELQDDIKSLLLEDAVRSA